MHVVHPSKRDGCLRAVQLPDLRHSTDVSTPLQTQPSLGRSSSASTAPPPGFARHAEEPLPQNGTANGHGRRAAAWGGAAEQQATRAASLNTTRTARQGAEGVPCPWLGAVCMQSVMEGVHDCSLGWSG